MNGQLSNRPVASGVGREGSSASSATYMKPPSCGSTAPTRRPVSAAHARRDRLQVRTGETRLKQVERQAALAEVTVDLAIRAGLENDLVHGHGAQPERAQAADWRLLEQQGRAAHGDQVKEALMNLDGEIRTVEMGLNGLRRSIQDLGDGAAFERANVAARDQAEPLRPGGRQFGEQGRTELLGSVQGGAVEQPLDRIGAGTEFRTEAGAALRQRVGVALPPQTFPAAPAPLGPLVSRPDGIEREVTHEQFSAGGERTKTAARAVLPREVACLRSGLG